MKKVVFACVHNAGRSQMAAAFFNSLADPLKARAVSAGTAPADRIHPEVVEVMREVGLDLAGVQPRKLSLELVEGAELLVTMGCGDQCPSVRVHRRDDWPLEDPKGKARDAVRAIREAVRAKVEALIESEGWKPNDAPEEEKARWDKGGVLFLCTGNSARSQMAEALLRKHAGHRFEAHSAGLSPAIAVHPLTLRVLRELGLETGSLYPKGAGGFLGRVSIRYAIIVCDQAAKECPHVYPFGLQTLYWPFEDPAAFEGSAEERLQKFREVRDLIQARILDWIRAPATV